MVCEKQQRQLLGKESMEDKSSSWKRERERYCLLEIVEIRVGQDSIRSVRCRCNGLCAMLVRPLPYFSIVYYSEMRETEREYWWSSPLSESSRYFPCVLSSSLTTKTRSVVVVVLLLRLYCVCV
jgi:hypothetical protein